MTEMMGLDTQERRMQAALSPVLTIGPDFLAGRRDADEMTHTMVRAVQEYALDEQARHDANVRGEDAASDPDSTGRLAQELQAALAEIYTCGTGYLANRCDSDCVARTMVQIMDEFGDLASAR